MTRIMWRIEGENGDSGSEWCDNWQKIKDILYKIRKYDGDVSMEKYDSSIEMIGKIRMEKIDGLFFLSVHYYGEKNDMKYLWDTSLPDEMVDWGGDDCDRRTLSDDHDFAEEMFRQYFHNGDVVSDILI